MDRIDAMSGFILTIKGSKAVSFTVDVDLNTDGKWVVDLSSSGDLEEELDSVEVKNDG